MSELDRVPRAIEEFFDTAKKSAAVHINPNFSDRLKLEQLQESIKADSNNQSLDEMKKMNVSPEAIPKVETSLQEEAKSKVTEIQGQYYETYD